jgi:hypothetical protein
MKCFGSFMVDLEYTAHLNFPPESIQHDPAMYRMSRSRGSKLHGIHLLIQIRIWWGGAVCQESTLPLEQPFYFRYFSDLASDQDPPTHVSQVAYYYACFVG